MIAAKFGYRSIKKNTFNSMNTRNFVMIEKETRKLEKQSQCPLPYLKVLSEMAHAEKCQTFKEFQNFHFCLDMYTYCKISYLQVSFGKQFQG